MKKKIGTSKSIKKYETGGEEGPGPKKAKMTAFQTDSLNFRKNERAYNKKPSVDLEGKMLDAFKKYGTKKLTGKSDYTLSDMVISDSYKNQRKTGGSVTSMKKMKMGGSVKSKKKK